MRITEKRLRQIIRSVIRESHMLDKTTEDQIETDISKVPDHQYFAWQEGNFSAVDKIYHDVLRKHFQDQGFSTY